jgi:hypothetical protein
MQEKTPRVGLAKGDTGATETLARARHQSPPSPAPPPGEAAGRSPRGRRRRRGGYSQFAGASRRVALTGIGSRPRTLWLSLAAVAPAGSPMAAAELGMRWRGWTSGGAWRTTGWSVDGGAGPCVRRWRRRHPPCLAGGYVRVRSGPTDQAGARETSPASSSCGADGSNGDASVQAGSGPVVSPSWRPEALRGVDVELVWSDLGPVWVRFGPNGLRLALMLCLTLKEASGAWSFSSDE